jgi:nitrite reductase (NADH) small subunit
MREIFIGERGSLDAGARIFVEVDGTEIGVFEYQGELFAYENVCRHQGGPVCEGTVLGEVEAILGDDNIQLGERFSTESMHLICPWHGWEYDLRTGRCATDPALALRKYDVYERDGELYVVLPDDE